eukprot:584239-Rhodomonas_salina.5
MLRKEGVPKRSRSSPGVSVGGNGEKAHENDKEESVRMRERSSVRRHDQEQSLRAVMGELSTLALRSDPKSTRRRTQCTCPFAACRTESSNGRNVERDFKK